jgi:putative acetyltransferase
VKYVIRRAGTADADDIAAAHLDSIRSIGLRHYSADVVREWSAAISGKLYTDAMSQGEVFFVAERDEGDGRDILGFSSHRNDDGEHGTAVYVRGRAARLGVGSALFKAAEASALAASAATLEIDASLAAVEFYKANGFDEIGRGEHVLRSGVSMPCVFMRKELRR